MKDGSLGEQSYIASARARHTLPDTGEVVDFPGGELQLYTRKGRVVIMGMSAGEYAGDLAGGAHGILDQVSSTVRKNLSAADTQFN